MGRSDLFENFSKGYWADLVASVLALTAVFFLFSAFVNLEALPWYLGILFFMSVFLSTDFVMYHVRLLPVWPWKR